LLAETDALVVEGFPAFPWPLAAGEAPAEVFAVTAALALVDVVFVLFDAAVFVVDGAVFAVAGAAGVAVLAADPDAVFAPVAAGVLAAEVAVPFAADVFAGEAAGEADGLAVAPGEAGLFCATAVAAIADASATM
jgi:hypothetical protein